MRMYSDLLARRLPWALLPLLVLAVPGQESGPQPGPQYLNLRYDEDFSYLGGEPGSYRDDLFDPVKYVPLGEDLHLTLGGEARFRLEAEAGKTFGARPRDEDTFTLLRAMLHGDLAYRDVARLFVQGVSCIDMEHDLPTRPIDRNELDLQQLFVDVRPLGQGSPLTVRAGRQDLQYGGQRLVSPLEWANTRRRFDALKAIWKEDRWQLDLFLGRPVEVLAHHADRWVEDVLFGGAYLTSKHIPRHTIDLYLLGIDRNLQAVDPNGLRGDEWRLTLGARGAGRTGPADYEAELAVQLGEWGEDDVSAWAGAVRGGLTFESCPWQPRLGLDLDLASGDDDPMDGEVNTFDQLFPLGHAWLGFLDLVGRQNIVALRGSLAFYPRKPILRLGLDYHAFWLYDDRDALYNPASKAGRRDPTGRAGDEVGQELDLTARWAWPPHTTYLLGYSYFRSGDLIEGTGPDQDPHLLYLQVQVKF
jgi:hypothetical protein